MANAKQTADQIRPVKKKAEKDLLKKPGVTGIDIGPKIVKGKKTDEMSIRVYVSEKKDVPAKDRIPKEIQGVKTDVIQLTFKPTAFVPVTEIAPRVDATRYAELRGGMSIGPCRSIHLEPPEVTSPGNYIFVGTLGAVVVDNGTGDHMLLTNFHVAAVDDSWSSSDAMAQPSRPDGGSCPGDRVGVLERAVISGTTAGGNPGVDGAVIRITERTPRCEVIGIGDILGTAVAAEDMAVRKRGRTTELTHGIVGSTDLTVTVPYGNGIGDVTLEDQILIDVDETQSAAFGISGDSGSVVVNSDNRVVGLYFAGNIEERDAAGNVVVPEGVVGIANPIAAVEAALNVRVCAAKTFEKKIEDKEFEKRFDKLWVKEHIKEYKEKDVKESIKDHKEPKEIYEDKRIEKQFEKQAEKHLEKRVEKSMEAGPGLPGVPRTDQAEALLEQRLARLEAAMRLAPQVEPFAGTCFCEDFSTMGIQQLPNPWTHQGSTLTSFDHQGAPLPFASIKAMGGSKGLDAGFRLRAAFACICPAVEVDLTHFARPATVQAFDLRHNLVTTATMTAAQGVQETLLLQGDGIASIAIIAPQNETLVHRICCAPERRPPKWEKEKEVKLEKPEKVEKRETKDKNEIKDKHEIKDFKDHREKELHEHKRPEKWPEKWQEKQPEGWPEQPPALPEDLLHRLERLEAALGLQPSLGHFIPERLRPDLSSGALKQEPDFQDVSAQSQLLHKQAAEGKQTKDGLDSGSKPFGG